MTAGYVWVGVGGLLGSVTRYWLSAYITARTGSHFPLGTFLINVSGALLIGFLSSVGADRGLLSPHVRLALTTGFLGGYTTFSTFSLEAIRLFQGGSVLLASLYVLGSVLAGLSGAFIGLSIGRAWR